MLGPIFFDLTCIFVRFCFLLPFTLLLPHYHTIWTPIRLMKLTEGEKKTLLPNNLSCGSHLLISFIHTYYALSYLHQYPPSFSKHPLPESLLLLPLLLKYSRAISVTYRSKSYFCDGTKMYEAQLSAHGKKGLPPVSFWFSIVLDRFQTKSKRSWSTVNPQRVILPTFPWLEKL